MHQVCTFVLRLFVNPQEPAQIKGSLQNILGAAPVPFDGAAALLELLRTMAEMPGEASPGIQQTFSHLDGGKE